MAADPAAPATPDPFEQLATGGPLRPAPNNDNTDPFEQLAKSGGTKPPDDTSTLGAFGRGVARNVIPAIGSFPAIGAGAEMGAAAGAPLAPFTAGLSVPAGGLIGGIAGAFLGSTALSSAQHWALSKMPDSWREAIGMDDRQEKLDEGQHPVASFLGGLTPYAMTMRPGALGMKGPQLPENATALQRIIANPVTARVFGGAAMGGMELGNEAGSGESPDWTKVAIATGFGLVFNKPTKIGEGLTEIGARPARSLLGRPEPTAVAPPAGAPAEAPPAEPAAPPVRPPGITEREWNETLLGQKQPTVAQAADTNVAGPGITEATFLGGEERSTEAALTAHDTARAEDSVTKEPKQQTVHDIARRIEPETFERYDALTARRDEFRRWIDEFNTPPPEAFQDLERQRADLQSRYDEHVASQGGYEAGKDARRLRAQIRDVEAQRNALADRATKYMGGEAEETPDLAMARKHLMDTEYELRDLAPQVRAAYGRAADAVGAGTVPPEPVQAAEAAPAAPEPAAGPPAPPLIPDQAPPAAAAGPVVKPIADQKAFIAQDVARQMVAAGRPADEAEAAGKLVAARYEARAARLKGAIGTAEELYRTESAEIRGPGGRRAPPAPAAPPAASVKLAAEFKPGPAPRAPEAPIPESEITTTAVGPKASRGARARDPSTWSLMEYLVDRGGISPDEKNISDLRSIFGKNNKFVPGFGQLIRPGGMSLDRALEAAVEAGYIHDEGRMSGGETQVGHKDLTDLLALEERGQKQYRIGQEAKAEGEDPAQRLHHIEGALDQALTAHEIPPASVTGKLRDRVIEIMDKEGATDPISAWERAVLEQDENAARAGEIEPRTESLPGWDVPDDAGAARGAGPAAQAEQVAQREGAGPAAPAPGEGAAQTRELAQEPGAEGKPQGLIPGVEPVTDAQRAQLEADRPLQGGAEPAGGMFDEAARGQREFWQRDPAAPFYSAVDRAVENVKLEKGSPEQWLGTIRNATGVKAEEMEWLGIADWLKEQQGPITKQQVQDFIRANNIKVEEVHKGGVGQRTLGDAAIAEPVRMLHERGIHPELNPDDEATMAFVTDPESIWEGDIITSDEIRDEVENGNVPRAVFQAARRVEDYWAGRTPPANGPDIGERAAQLTQAVHPGSRVGVGDWDANFEAAVDHITGQSRMELPEVDAYQNEASRQIRREQPGLDDESDHFREDVMDRMGELHESAQQALDHEAAHELPKPTKFGQWVMPGGTNYREMLLTLPPTTKYVIEGPVAARYRVVDQATNQMLNHFGTREEAQAEINELNAARGAGPSQQQNVFRGGHWDEPNVLAHTRFNDRTIDGKKTLFIEEIQSDWHQQGRKRGYEMPQEERRQLEMAADHARTDVIDAISAKWSAMTDGAAHSQTEARDLGIGRDDLVRMINKIDADDHIEKLAQIRDAAKEKFATARNGVPDAPFKTTWPELAMKRMIRYAAENGYEQIGWTPGDVQALRYPNELRKAVEKIEWSTPGHGHLGEGGIVPVSPEIQAIVDKMLPGQEGRHPGSIGTVGLNQHVEAGRITMDEAVALREWDRKNPETTDTQGRPIRPVGRGPADPNKYVHAKPKAGGMDMVFTVNQEGKIVEASTPAAKGKMVDEVFGKDMATKIMADHEGTIEGKDFVLGSHGMREFYDQMLPKAANKLVKKFGTKVGEATLEQPKIGRGGFEHAPETEAALQAKEGDATVHTIPITDELRDAATGEGFPLFQGARGSIKGLPREAGAPLSGKPIMTIMRDANASTAIHEFGHQFLEEILRDAQHPAAPADLKADAATVRKWVGASPDGNLKTAHHEKFARGFEQYLREGTAPSQELAGVFARFKDWLLRIYQTISGLGKPINEDIRSVFDRMLAEEPKRTVLAPERAGGPTLADIHEVDAQHTEPAEAEPAMDRVLGEAARAEAELPPQVQHELETKIAEAEAARAATAGAEPAGQGGAGAGQPAEVEPAGGGPKPEPAGGAGGEEPGEVVRGGAEAGGQGAGVPEPERGPAGGAGPDANPLAPTPARVLEPREPKLVDKAGNIRIENLTSVSDIAQAIRESAERNADFQAVRGQATMGEMMNLADAISIDPTKIDEGQLANLFGGYENMAPKIWALRKALVDSAQIVSNAMKLVREDASDANAAAMALAMTRHDMLQSTLSKATAESGRTLGMAFKNLEGWENAQDLDQFMKANTGRTLFQLKMIAKLGAQLDTPAKVSKFLRDAQKRSFPGMILEYWINGLISGIATHTTYMMGNTGLAAIRAVPETLVAAAIGRLREAGGEQGAHVKFGEVPAGIGAAVRGLPAAIEATLEAARSGVTTLLPGEKARPSMPFAGENQIVVGKNATNEPVTWGDVKNQVSGIMRGLRDGIVANGALLAAGGEPGAPLIGTMYSPLGQIPDIGIRGVNVLPLGTIARIPSRGIAAIHSFFRSVNYSIEKGRDAYRTAAAEGLQGEAFDRRAGEVWSDPTEEQMAKYRFESTEATLMGQGGAFTQKLSQLMNVEVGGWRPLKFIDPFVHISSNIIKQTIVERTPAGILSPEIRADLMGRPDPITGKIDIAARDMAQARMLVGTALGVTFAGLASQGVISGSGPKDRNEAAMWRLAGNQAHSVRIGDTWWDMHRLGPLGMLLGISADMYELAHKVEEGEYLDAAQHLQHAITQNVLDESFMRGPASLIQAIEDPDRYGQAYIKNTLASFIPFSVGLSQQARAMDPYTRQTRTVVDAIRQKIPGHLDTLFGAELFPKRDIWGEPMPNPDALIKAGLTAIYAKQMSSDPVNKAMIELGIGPAPVARKIRNVDLDDKQYDDFSRLSGRMTKQRLDVIVRSADWNSWTPNIKGTVVQEVIKQSREAARGVMMMKYPQIVRDATQAKRDAFTEEPEAIR